MQRPSQATGKVAPSHTQVQSAVRPNSSQTLAAVSRAEMVLAGKTTHPKQSWAPTQLLPYPLVLSSMVSTDLALCCGDIA